MAQFDVYENPSTNDATHTPYLLDVQSKWLSDFPTRVVVPLVTAAAWGGYPASRLHPELRIRGKTCVMLTTHIAGIPTSDLGARITNLATARDEIIAAIDVLITGV